jgi:hypothetical protein
MFEGGWELYQPAASALAGIAVAALAFVLCGLVGERATPVAGGAGGPRSKGVQPERDALLKVLLPLATGLAWKLPLSGMGPSLAVIYGRAGRPGDYQDRELLGLGLLIGFGLCIPVVFTLFLFAPALAPFGVLAASLGPTLLHSNYSSKVKKRDLSISRNMPFMLDLLVLAMRAGASFQQSLERVAVDYAGLALGDEASKIIVDLSTGATMAEALTNFHERVPIVPVRTFVDDLIQGDELGRPLADVLLRLSGKSRITRVQDAEEMAGSAKVLVLIPGMLVFIASLILLLAPFLLEMGGKSH